MAQDRRPALLGPALFLASWGGVGLLPKAPGTWGSLAALPFAWAIAAAWGPHALAPAALVLALVGWAACRIVLPRAKSADPAWIVVDEVAGMWLTLAVAPVAPLAWGLGFVLFRAADIVKPWPVSWADRTVGGGLGVMLDDLLAALYAGAALAALGWLIGW